MDPNFGSQLIGEIVASNSKNKKNSKKDSLKKKSPKDASKKSPKVKSLKVAEDPQVKETKVKTSKLEAPKAETRKVKDTEEKKPKAKPLSETPASPKPEVVRAAAPLIPARVAAARLEEDGLDLLLRPSATGNRMRRGTGNSAVLNLLGGMTRSERAKDGRAKQNKAPIEGQGVWVESPLRESPIVTIERSSEGRVPELVPLRYGRMLATPFTYFRGAPAVMASDLATTKSSEIEVQACGDAHLLNFGLFGTPERNLTFDVNDFDETHPGPWEWDVKRLCTSLVIAAREYHGEDDKQLDPARAASIAYRENMERYSKMARLDVWYERTDLQRISDVSPDFASSFAKSLKKVGRRTNKGTTEKMTEVINGTRRLIDDPPLITHVSDIDDPAVVESIARYRDTLDLERRYLFDQYQLVDIARKVVGIGSVGTRALAALFVSRDAGDPLLLQIKEAIPSVLAPYVTGHEFKHEGERVVHGQRLMQAASDMFLGWTENVLGNDKHYFVRQLRDMKLSADIALMSRVQLEAYGMACGWTLARAHAKTGDSTQITGYIAGDPKFDDAMVSFATAYADQNEKDYAEFAAAIADGRLAAIPGV
ncbi:hypothetical protein IMCC26256_111122 [Actinobacteria bacterium IMCC26256]|nr:hypothetical protein IMCC26256_111122 [Actinobacteria bacterium IMCC26256]